MTPAIQRFREPAARTERSRTKRSEARARRASREIGSLTGIEGHFADHDPSVREMEPQLNELADSMMKLDRDVARSLEDLVLHVRVRDGLSRVISSTDAEEYVDLRKYLQIHRSKGRFEWHSGMVIPIKTNTRASKRATIGSLRRSDRRIIESRFSISYAAAVTAVQINFLLS